MVISIERIIEAIESSMIDLEMPGFCMACGADAYGIDPDADSLACEDCDAMAVCGAEYALILIG